MIFSVALLCVTLLILFADLGQKDFFQVIFIPLRADCIIDLTLPTIHSQNARQVFLVSIMYLPALMALLLFNERLVTHYWSF